MIGQDDWSEKTGNVSFFVEISAFNRNYSVYESMSHHTRDQDWRWRLSEQRFNLTILSQSEYALAKQKSRIVCFNGQRRTLAARENCEVMFSQNITIDHLGQITIELGDYFSFPDDFEYLSDDGNNKLSSIFQVSLLPNSFHRLNFTIEMTSYSASKLQGINRRKKIGERTVKELVGLSPENFLDSDRYKTTVKKSSNILVLKITFDSPWYVSVN